MKHLFFCLAFSLCFISAKAQNITADTLKANALYKQAKSLEKQRRYDSALLLYRQTLPLYEKHKLWEKYYKSGNDEVRSLILLKRRDSASSLGERYLESTKQNLPEFSTAKAKLAKSVGTSYYYQSQYKKALPYWQKSLDINLELFGEKHIVVADGYNNVALLYHYQSQYEKALEYHQKSLSIKLELFGEKHTGVADTYNNMALIQDSQSRYKKALEFFQKSLSIKLELLGEKHIKVAEIYNNIAILYKKQSQYQKALEFYQKGLTISLELQGEKHTRVANTYNNIANLYQSLSQSEKALEFFQKSLSIYLELLGEKHTYVAITYNNMASVYTNQPPYKKAFEFYQKGLSIYLELLGEKHIAVARTYDNLGILYRELGKYDSAAYYHHKAVKAASKSFESDNFSQNPKPEQALEKYVLMKYLRTKAQALTLLGQEKNALKTYAIASACAEQAMQEADREEDKLEIASEAYLVYTQAALLHFTQKGRIQKVKNGE